MNLKNLFSIILISISILFYISFVQPFKASVLDPVSLQLDKIKSASEKAAQLLSLNSLRQKKQSLGEAQSNILASFVPKNLHSGDLIYRLSGMATQNRLNVKGVQFSVVDDKTSSDKKLLIEMNLDGRYEDFSNWLGLVEKSSTLIDVESIRATKNNINNAEIISFTVKMYAYGINID